MLYHPSSQTSASAQLPLTLPDTSSHHAYSASTISGNGDRDDMLSLAAGSDLEDADTEDEDETGYGTPNNDSDDESEEDEEDGRSNRLRSVVVQPSGQGPNTSVVGTSATKVAPRGDEGTGENRQGEWETLLKAS